MKTLQYASSHPSLRTRSTLSRLMYILLLGLSLVRLVTGTVSAPCLPHYAEHQASSTVASGQLNTLAGLGMIGSLVQKSTKRSHSLAMHYEAISGSL